MNSTTCRACLKRGHKMKSLFALGTIYGKTLSLKDVLVTCADLHIISDDGLPQHLCLICIGQIEKAYSFRMMCEKNQKALLDQVKERTSYQFIEIKAEDYILECSNLNKDDNEVEYLEQSADEYSEIEVDEHKNNTNISPESSNKLQKIVSTKEKLQEIKANTLAKTTPASQTVPQLTNSFRGKYPCGYCKNVYKFKSSLDLHVIRNHSNIPKSDPSSLICNICNKKCQSADQYKRHLNFHRTGKEYHCDICGRDFAQQRTFVSHTYSHTGERPFLCTECGKRFKQSVDLRIHMRLHLNIFPYTCKICGKKFRYSSRFTIHKRRHAGIKPFECPFCDKKFICSDRLQVHKRVHTGEKPFPCKICGKAFARSSALKVHSQTHTGEKPHICTKCNRGFSQAHCLRSHMKIHEKYDTLSGAENYDVIETDIKLENDLIIEEAELMT